MDRNKKAREEVLSERDKRITQLINEFNFDSDTYEKHKKWFENVPTDTNDRLDEMMDEKTGFEIMLEDGYDIIDPKFKFEKSNEWKAHQVKCIEKKINRIEAAVKRIKIELSVEFERRKEHMIKIEQSQSLRVEELKKYGIEKTFKPSARKADYIG